MKNKVVYKWLHMYVVTCNKVKLFVHNWHTYVVYDITSTYPQCIKTHDSESQGQEEAQQRDHRVSYLHVAPPSNSQTL